MCKLMGPLAAHVFGMFKMQTCQALQCLHACCMLCMLLHACATLTYHTAHHRGRAASGGWATSWAPTQTSCRKGLASWTHAMQVRALQPASKLCTTLQALRHGAPCSMQWRLQQGLQSAGGTCLHVSMFSLVAALPAGLPVTAALLHQLSSSSCCTRCLSYFAIRCLKFQLAHRRRDACHVPGLWHQLHAAPVAAVRLCYRCHLRWNLGLQQHIWCAEPA